MGLALTSLILGCLSFLGSCLLVNVILGPLAIIFGIIGLVKAFKRPETHGGKWLAGIGLTLGAVSMLTIPIIAAIAIPNFIDAVQRGRQKRTVTDMTSIARALEQYRSTHESYPPSDSVFKPLKELSDQLAASGFDEVPLTDGWNRDILYYRSAFEPDQYLLVSKGRDGTMQGHSLDDYMTIARDRWERRTFDTDIVMVNGNFILSPQSSSP